MKVNMDKIRHYEGSRKIYIYIYIYIYEFAPSASIPACNSLLINVCACCMSTLFLIRIIYYGAV